MYPTKSAIEEDTKSKVSSLTLLKQINPTVYPTKSAIEQDTKSKEI